MFGLCLAGFPYKNNKVGCIMKSYIINICCIITLCEDHVWSIFSTLQYGRCKICLHQSSFSIREIIAVQLFLFQ